MKRFLLFFLYLTICLIVADRVFSLVLDHFYDKMRTGQTGGKINFYRTMYRRPPLLIMGNSRALYQLIPDSFDIEAYNLSHAGMGIAFQTGLLSILESEKKLPEHILLHIEPIEFTGSPLNTDIQNLKYYYGKDPVVTHYINSISCFEKMKFAFQLYRYNGRVLTLLKNCIQSRVYGPKGNGYEPVTPTDRDSLNTMYSLRSSTISDRPLNYGQLHVLLEFIETCKHNNTQLVCFTSPVFRAGHLYKTASLVLDSVLAANQVPYINYTQEPISYLEEHPEVWKNFNHLNHEGAQVESGLLAARLTEELTKLRTTILKASR